MFYFSLFGANPYLNASTSETLGRKKANQTCCRRSITKLSISLPTTLVHVGFTFNPINDINKKY